jgi:hypothetical protein
MDHGRVGDCGALAGRLLCERPAYTSRKSESRRFIRFHNSWRVRCANVRDTADFDLDRASVATSAPTRSLRRRRVAPRFNSVSHDPIGFEPYGSGCPYLPFRALACSLYGLGILAASASSGIVRVVR